MYIYIYICIYVYIHITPLEDAAPQVPPRAQPSARREALSPPAAAAADREPIGVQRRERSSEKKNELSRPGMPQSSAIRVNPICIYIYIYIYIYICVYYIYIYIYIYIYTHIYVYK